MSDGFETDEGSQILLKAATIADIPQLLQLEKSVANTDTYSPMLEEKEWEEALRKGAVFLIQIGNVIVGNLSYEREENERLYISGLVISPEFQGQGIAREVLIKLLEEYKNTKRVDLVTHPDNVIALELYQSLGFVVESRKEDYYGDGEPRLVLVKTNSPN